jgi:RNA polymerase sigma-70 factor (ECF subfamily)
MTPRRTERAKGNVSCRVTFPPRATSWWKHEGNAVTDQDQLAADFDTHRPYLRALAHRVLGSHADADDAVQEAWLRLARTGGADIDELRGWLTTVTGRICLDILRRRGARGEQPLELELWTTPGDFGADPEADAVLADSVGLALYVVMDALTPAERVSFVLHDVFEMPFDTIAAILDRSTAATKMLASRARARIRLGAPRPTPTRRRATWSTPSWPRPVRATSPACSRCSPPTSNSAQARQFCAARTRSPPKPASAPAPTRRLIRR